MLTTWLAILPHTILAMARLVNVTIDDHDPLIQYTPIENHWLSLDQDCSSCATAPDPSLVYNHTWHDATYNFSNPTQSAPQSLAFRFNGSAIYAYGILSSLSDQSTDLWFYIDNEPVEHAGYTGSDTDATKVTYAYNVLFYSNTSLQHGEHVFGLQNGQGDGGPASLILFDYLIYTTEVDDATSTTTTPSATSSSTSPSTSTPTPIPRSSQTLVEVLPVVLPICLVIITVICIHLWRRREKRKATARALEMAQADDDFQYPISPFFPVDPYFVSSSFHSRRSSEYGEVLSARGGKGTRRSDTPPLYSSLRFASDDDSDAPSSSLLAVPDHGSSTVAEASATSGAHRVSSPPPYISDEGHKDSVSRA